MDRISRDQEHVAGLHKRLGVAGVRMVTVQEGDIGALQIGFKGAQNAMFLADLAAKTRRGLQGLVEDGRSAGGRCFGYDLVRTLEPDGLPVRGELCINEAEAAVVRRILNDYATGLPSRTIAHALDAEGVPGPQGAAWGPSTIHGNRQRGIGILNNELYVGRRIWNWQRFIKNPDTGKRVARLNDRSERITREVPELRIVDDALWDAVQQRQSALAGPVG